MARNELFTHIQDVIDSAYRALDTVERDSYVLDQIVKLLDEEIPEAEQAARTSNAYATGRTYAIGRLDALREVKKIACPSIMKAGGFDARRGDTHDGYED